MRKIIVFLLVGVGFIGLCAAQTTSAVNYRQEGIASWYGNEFDGRKTASGEMFDSTLYTAAHPTLPFQTILTVTNVYNNRKVRVKINDRGPFVTGRIIDLSKAAAEVLDMVSTGTAMVVIESSSEIALGPVSAAARTLQLAAITPPSPMGSSGAAPSVASVTPVAAGTEITAVRAPAESPVRVDAPDPVRTQAPFVSAEPAAVAVALPEPRLHESVLETLAGAAKPAAQTERVQPSLPPAQQNVTGAITMGPDGIKGNFPPAGNGKVYRLQVGAYKVPKNAVDAYEKLKNAGLSPKYERNEDTEIYRVVLAGLRPEDIHSVAERLYSAGFTEVFFREER
jgi:rare lipoprotein A